MDAPDKRIQQHRNVIFAAKNAGVKKIVYTSVIGEASGSSFSPIVASNRQTEEDIKNSGMEWGIGIKTACFFRSLAQPTLRPVMLCNNDNKRKITHG